MWPRSSVSIGAMPGMGPSADNCVGKWLEVNLAAAIQQIKVRGWWD
jgi:hypothetical protein